MSNVRGGCNEFRSVAERNSFLSGAAFALGVALACLGGAFFFYPASFDARASDYWNTVMKFDDNPKAADISALKEIVAGTSADPLTVKQLVNSDLVEELNGTANALHGTSSQTIQNESLPSPHDHGQRSLLRTVGICRMTRDGRRLLEHFSFGKCEQLGGFYRAEVELEHKTFMAS
jgi:hypothetical protein